MFLTFIRHGKTTAAEQGLSQSGEVALSERSIEVLKERAKTVDASRFSCIYTSTYKRAQQTAEILFGKSNIKILDYVHEARISPHLHGKTHKEVDSYWLGLPEKTRFDPDHKHTDGVVVGESFNESSERISQFIDYLIENHGGAHVALVGHGMFFQVLLAQLMKSPGFDFRVYSDFFRYFKLENGCEITVEIDETDKSGVIREMKNWHIM